MIWRHELKYIIDEATFHNLYFTLRPILHGDQNAKVFSFDGIRNYRIRSLYFDDEERSSVFEKLAGVDNRHKYRIRIYNDCDLDLHLERKTKRNNLSCKQSCRLTRAQVDGLLAGDPEVLLEDRQATPRAATGPGHMAERSAASVADQHNLQLEMQLLNEFYAEIRTRLLKPMILVDYERIPLVWPDGNVRITFDRNLATGLYRQDIWDEDAGLMPVLEPGYLILEVKYDRFLPDFISSLLTFSGAGILSISKYAQCAGFIRTHSWEDQN
jgi:SPX domain protein involved in polyphosphate accumulation